MWFRGTETGAVKLQQKDIQKWAHHAAKDVLLIVRMRHLEKRREEEKQGYIRRIKKTSLGALAPDATSPFVLFHLQVAELVTKFAATASAVAPSYSPGLFFLQAALPPQVVERK